MWGRRVERFCRPLPCIRVRTLILLVAAVDVSKDAPIYAHLPPTRMRRLGKLTCKSANKRPSHLRDGKTPFDRTISVFLLSKARATANGLQSDIRVRAPAHRIAPSSNAENVVFAHRLRFGVEIIVCMIGRRYVARRLSAIIITINRIRAPRVVNRLKRANFAHRRKRASNVPLIRVAAIDGRRRAAPSRQIFFSSANIRADWS